MKKMFITSIVAAADYVGEAVAPVLDLEIDTAGVVDANYYTIL